VEVTETVAVFKQQLSFMMQLIGFVKSFTRSRTVDQMVQAARSGRQNIAEGSPRSWQLPHRQSFAL